MVDSSFSPGFWWWLFLAIFSPFVAVSAVHTAADVVVCYKVYLWLAVGIAAFFVLDRTLIKGEDDTIRIFSHEINHAVVSILLFKKVHSFHVERDHGVVYHTAGGRFSSVLINLAPYCLPLYTYVLLIARAAMQPSLYWVADMLIGITVGFYISFFKQGIGPHQTDISQYRQQLFPYWYIFTFIIFNASIILHSLLPHKNVFLSFADTFVDYWHYIVDFVNKIR